MGQIPIPHGHKVRDTNGYRRTCPSVLKAIKRAVTSETPAKIYKDMVTANTIPTQQGILNPRNTRQVINMRHSISAAKRLSKDDIYNLIQLAYHTPETIWKVELYTDLACVVGVKELMDELNVLLDTKSGTLLGYDTTFKLGDFYVSILVFRHAVFNESPVIPVAFLIHDRKFQKVHERFFEQLLEQIPNLGKASVKIVTDREVGITNALKKVFPNAHVLHCWNHILRDRKCWLRKHGASPDDILVYKQDILTILKSESEDDLNRMLDLMTGRWSQAMIDYFNDGMKPGIIRHSAKFVLAPLDLYDPYSGITNNISETINCVIKDMLKWRETPVDVIFLCFQLHQTYYLAEIRRGFAGVGNYTLSSNYKHCSCDLEDVVMPQDICQPQDIVNRIRRMTQSDGIIEDNKSALPKQVSVDNLTAIDDTPSEELTAPQRNISQRALADAVVREGRIRHVLEMGALMVDGSRGDKYAVSLFPNEKCQCPSTGTCYHIRAARISVGLTNKDDKRILNLSQL